MKNEIYARIVARPISFPESIAIDYYPLDKQDFPLGVRYIHPKHLTWEEVKHRFAIDLVYANECEDYFADGHAANLGHRTVTGEFLEPGDGRDDLALS
jgi:hypothetical protein